MASFSCFYVFVRRTYDKHNFYVFVRLTYACYIISFRLRLDHSAMVCAFAGGMTSGGVCLRVRLDCRGLYVEIESKNLFAVF